MLEQALTTTRIISADYLDAGELDRLALYCGGPDARVAVITDNRPFDLRDTLLAGWKGLRDIRQLDRVFPDPKTEDIMAMADSLREDKPSVIVGIGGGSTLDSAKAVAAVLSNGGDLDDYLGAEPRRTIGNREVKLILIPTTAGTGSEVTRFGVYTSRSGRKYTLAHPLLQADVAVLASEFTYGMPPALRAATAFDALSHALETIWNRHATPVSDRAAVEAAAHILKWIEPASKGDTEAQREMLRGACMAGIAFNLTGTAAVHALSFILSEQWHIPHGTACAFTLEDVLRINRQHPETTTRLALIGQTLGWKGTEPERVDRLDERIRELKEAFGLPSVFADLGIKADTDRLEELFTAALDDPKMKNNIVPFDRQTINTIIRNKCQP